MTNLTGATVVQKNSADAAMTAVAHEPDTSVDVVRRMYEQGFPATSVQAIVKTFVGVITSENVKRYSRGSGAKH